MKYKSLLMDYEIGTVIKVEGKIIEQLFYNEENTYGVYRFESVENKTQYYVVSGYFPYPIQANTIYVVTGAVSSYKDDKQIKLESIFITMPNTELQLINALKQIKGINKLADDIVAQYSMNSISYCINYPYLVAEQIKGIHKSLAEELSVQLQLRYAQIDIREQLTLWGFTTKQADAIAQKLGQSALLTIRKNPYELIDLIQGIGFKTIDKLAAQFGFNRFSDVRAMAAIRYFLMEEAMQGHCYITKDILINKLKSILTIQLSPFECASLLAKGSNQKTISYEYDHKKYNLKTSQLISFMDTYDEEQDEHKRDAMFYFVDGFTDKKIDQMIATLVEEGRLVLQHNRIYLQEYYIAELKFAYKVIQLLLYEGTSFLDNEKTIADVVNHQGYKLETKQLEAVKTFTAETGGFMILNGSAGCGKTFTLNIILSVLEKLYEAQGHSLNVHIMAPTGKAAQVASIATKRIATTIHRGLKWKPEGGFQYNEKEPLPCDVLVVDEASMLDIRLAYQLSKAIKPSCKVIFMGDTKQLQSVGAGNVLHDLIATGLVPIVTLDVVKRQGKDSGIVENARRIIAGKMIISEQEKADSYVIASTSAEHTLQLLVKGIQKLVTSGRFSLAEIQVLSPVRKGILGVDYINYTMQQTFNLKQDIECYYPNKTVSLVDGVGEQTEEKVVLNFFVGDKVIHLVNDYAMPWYKWDGQQFINIDKVGITNGECGVITSITKLPSATTSEQIRVTVQYDEGYVHYINPGAELDHAYAMTIHKSQGSQWPAVFMPVAAEHRHMLTNSLIYTGFTRAKTFQCVIGQHNTINQAIKNDTMESRLTSLRERFIVQQ